MPTLCAGMLKTAHWMTMRTRLALGMGGRAMLDSDVSALNNKSYIIINGTQHSATIGVLS